MAVFIVTTEIDDELDALFETDPDEASAADLLLSLLYENGTILDDLRPPQTVYQYSPTFEFKIFEEAQKQGLNVYILKYQDPEHGHLCKHRILVGYHPQRDRFYALTIIPRDADYATDSAEFLRLANRYELYGIPPIPGARVR